MRALIWLGACAALTAIGACGGKTAPPKSGAVNANEPGWKLGHYSSGDGLLGVVIDRTGERPKIRVDGTKEVVELLLEDETDSRGHWLNGPDGKHWLFLSEGGSLEFIKPEARAKATLGATRWGFVGLGKDAEAERLGTAGATGIATPPEPKSPYALFNEKLTAMSVTSKHPQFKSEDSDNLTKVAEAFQKIDSTLLVHLGPRGPAHARWVPGSPYLDGTNHVGWGSVSTRGTHDVAWDTTKPGIQRYGVFMKGHPSFGEPSRITLLLLKGWPAPLLPNTPGIVWAVHAGVIVFVTLDGGRYEIAEFPGDFDKEGPPLEMGLSPQASWPPPLQHALVDAFVVKHLGDSGAVSKKVSDDLVALEEAFFVCTGRLWKEGRAELDKLKVSPAPAPQRFEAESTIEKKYQLKAEKDCAPAVARYEQGLVKFIEARNVERLALYEKGKVVAKP